MSRARHASRTMHADGMNHQDGCGESLTGNVNCMCEEMDGENGDGYEFWYFVII